LKKASLAVFSAPDGWRAIFPRGSRDAIWHISLLSDASMMSAFANSPAAAMSVVIDKRFDQNADLKPFVRQVMLFDFLHPFQALARMQRTARAMYACLGAGNVPSWLALTRLNIAYTAIVFVWLCDDTLDDVRTKAVTRPLMRACGLS
jgi:hypothetical protein